MKKGDMVEGTIETVDFPNKGILKADGKEIIVKNVIPGQVVRGRVNKKKAGKIEACLLEVLQHSPMETCAAGCSLFPDCGGCLYRTMEYSSQLKMKEQQIRRLIRRRHIAGKLGEVKRVVPDNGLLQPAGVFRHQPGLLAENQIDRPVLFLPDIPLNEILSVRHVPPLLPHRQRL